MLNTDLLKNDEEYNSFTILLSTHIKKNGSAMAKLRNGLYAEIQLDIKIDEYYGNVTLTEIGFINPHAGHMKWFKSGKSKIVKDCYDIIEANLPEVDNG